MRIKRNAKTKKSSEKRFLGQSKSQSGIAVFKNIVGVDSNPPINFSTSEGVIGIDCNVDHFAWADISKDGNYLDSGTFSFSVRKKIMMR